MSENQSFLQEFEGRSQKLTFSRRQLLQKIASAALLFFVPRPQIFSFCQTPKPEFWFGDTVGFRWNDEITGDEYSETGEIVGVAWNSSENQWEYRVTWLSSTAYPADVYPCFEGNFVPAEVLCKI